MLLSELHVGHVEQAFRRLFDEGMTSATARRLFSTLRTALNAAVRERLIPDNPARYVKLPRGARRGSASQASRHATQRDSRAFSMPEERNEGSADRNLVPHWTHHGPTERQKESSEEA